MSRQRVDAPTTIRNAYGQFAIIPSSLVRATELSDGALRLYALLWDYSSSTDREAWPTRTTMAGDLGVSVDTIDRRVNELAKFGAISVEVDLQSDARRNVYTILQLDQSRVIPKGRKSAANSVERVGRTDAAQLGRKSAAAYKEEPEPSNQKTTVRSSKHPNDGAVDNSGTGPQPPLATPKTVSHTFGKPLVPADVFAAVGKWMPVTFDDEQMTQLANEIIAESGARAVDDRTAYVIRAIRNTVRDDERRRGRWLLRADEIALETKDRRERAGVRF